MLRRLFYFNPDTDFALGCKTAFYTPPAEVVRLKNNLRLIQLFVAGQGDAIIVDDSGYINRNADEKLFAFAAKKGVSILTLQQIHQDYDSLSFYGASFNPWGWNDTMRRIAVRYLGDLIELPEKSYVDLVRNLAHRRTAIKGREIICECEPELYAGISKEIDNLSDVIRFTSVHPGAYVKLPWSSSGRGVLPTSRFTPNQIEEWTRGAIRRQGSVIVEENFPSILDFASEWYMKDGKAEFVGWSVFNTSNKGQYEGNILQNNVRIEEMIFASAAFPADRLLDIQKIMLEQVGSGYSGPVGIDMMLSPTGRINPCVEINFRYTMGHMAVEASKNSEEITLFYDLMSTLNYEN